MTLFPVHRPNWGVSIRGNAISIVQMRRDWMRRLSVRRFAERPLPPNLLTPSAVDLNVGDMDTLAKELKTLIHPLRIRTIALSLPDPVATMAVFPFESLPSRRQERDAILKWRFEHEAHVPIGDARIKSQVLPVPAHVREALTPIGSTESITSYVLAVAIKRSILLQYQTLCERAGLLPVSIGVGSLQLFDCLRGQMSPSVEHHVMMWTPESSTFIGLRHGIPIFLRSKRRRFGSDIRMELLAMRQFLSDRFPSLESSQETGPSALYIVREPVTASIEEDTCSDQWTMAEHLGRSIHVMPLTWNAIDPQRSIASWGGLSALAGAVAA